MTLTAERLREVLSYDPETGLFIGRIVRRGRRVGDPTGTKNADGYVVIWLDGRLYYAHRLAWLYIYGRWPSATIDHRDNDRSNNRLLNLRSASQSQNNWNQGIPAHNTSGFKGVSRHRQSGRWQAGIKKNGKRIHLGLFDDLDAAAAAYAKAANDLHEEFARVA